MKMTIEFEGRTIIVEREDVVDICDAMMVFEDGLKEMGYEPQRIEAAVQFWADQIARGESWD